MTYEAWLRHFPFESCCTGPTVAVGGEGRAGMQVPFFV